MITGRNRFNIYFHLLLLIVAVGGGCETTEEKVKAQQDKRKEKQTATLRVHMEAPPSKIGDSTIEAPIFREKPVTVIVDKTAFLSEGEMLNAKVIADSNSFQVQIQFDTHGSLILEQYTSSHPGKHMAIFCEFGDPMKETRWLAAPLIRRGIPDGKLVFTPDATREEVEQIVLGLNNVAKKVQKELKW